MVLRESSKPGVVINAQEVDICLNHLVPGNALKTMLNCGIKGVVLEIAV
jgi:hypothetical protein